jgi:hypothetical protein
VCRFQQPNWQYGELLFVTGGTDLKNTIDKRIAELERKFRRSEVTLYFSDGTHQVIRMDPMDLFATAMREPDGQLADAIRRCVSSREAGGSRFVECAAALLNSPGESVAEDPTDFRRETEKEIYVH